jgi:prephenate dehydrogenase
VVLDLGSTKVEILRAMAQLPANFDPAGGHPMCGKEQAGLSHADRGLYTGAPFALTALPRTSERARALAEAVARAAGAQPLWLDAETHDKWVATTSHLPYALAALLAGATPVTAAALIGPGWRSSARLAATSAVMMLDIIRTNRANILEALQGYRCRLEKLEALIALEDDEVLSTWMVEQAAVYAELIRAS